VRVTGSTVADGTVRRVIAGYEYFLALASRVQWDEEAIDLSAGAELDDELLQLVAGFCIGEAGVAEHLAPFVSEGPAAECFAAQQRDEDRHERFFARYADAIGLSDPRAHLPEPFLELFEQRLPEAVRGAPADAVGLYHMVLEGVVFTAGQLALLERLDAEPRWPGLLAGTELVLRDERWHVGFGARCLQDAGLSDAAAEQILAEGERAAALWAPAQAEKVVEGLRRRLRMVR
jgi:ribonucleoside-diphosphate reductase beta chain